jgi:Mg/Co/Ni transporter MgtE
MKKTISGDTVNLIMGIVYAVMIAFRVTFFLLLGSGIYQLWKGNYKTAAMILLITAVWAGIVEPALLGAYKYANKNLDDQAARQEKSN